MVPPTAKVQGRACTMRLSRYQPVSRSGGSRRDFRTRRSGFPVPPKNPDTNTMTAISRAPTNSGSMPAPKPNSATLKQHCRDHASDGGLVVIRSPSKATSAGSSVTEPAITMATVAAAAMPKPVSRTGSRWQHPQQ